MCKIYNSDHLSYIFKNYSLKLRKCEMEWQTWLQLIDLISKTFENNVPTSWSYKIKSSFIVAPYLKDSCWPKYVIAIVFKILIISMSRLLKSQSYIVDHSQSMLSWTSPACDRGCYYCPHVGPMFDPIQQRILNLPFLLNLDFYIRRCTFHFH